MPPSCEKSSKRGYWPILIACCLLIGGAMWTSALLPDSAAVIETPRAATTTAFSCRLGVWEGQVARFGGNDPTPVHVYDVAAASLPEEVRQALAAGITLTSEEELAAWLENLTS